MSVIDKIAEEFAKILDIDDGQETIEYLFNIENESDVHEYLTAIIDTSVPRNQGFIDKLISEWRRVNARKAGSNFKVYQKNDEEMTYFSGKQEQKGKPKKGKQKSQSQKQASVQDQEADDSDDQFDKKKKFVPLFSQEGQERSVIKLPGRHTCNCQAHKHKLVNNCLKCGRIVCEQEGSGPCTFCGALVCTKEEQEILDRRSKKSDKLLTYLMGKGTAPISSGKTELTSLGASIGTLSGNQTALDRAVKNKERLLEYDRNCVKRTQVIDDECDYFSMDSNQWLSKEEKKKLKKREEELFEKRHGSRKDRKVTIDFAGRQILEEQGTVNMYDQSDEVIQEVYHGARPKSASTRREFTDDDFAPLLHPNMPMEPPLFVDEGEKPRKSYVSAVAEPEDRKRTLRIQDAELMEMTDQGKCLSMHQPFASLLVAGIKMHEGRTWYTTHRGRLWIASTIKEFYDEDIQSMESHYRSLLGSDVVFPQFYPRSCLLGCVEVVDCLPQQEYREQFPDGDSDSPFVLICRNPHELSIKFPIQGQHKIYRLDAQTHKAAKLGVMRDANRRQKQLDAQRET